MKPYKQGDMDSLCGIYSIINASRLLMKKLSEDDCEKLLGKMIRLVEKKRKMSTIITMGIEALEIETILDEIMKKHFAVESRRPFLWKRKMTIDRLWKEIHDFFEENGSNRSVIIGIENSEWGHWTVIQSMTSKQARLFDSSCMIRINRKLCTTGKRTREKPLALGASNVFFLWKDKPGKEKRKCSKKA